MDCTKWLGMELNPRHADFQSGVEGVLLGSGWSATAYLESLEGLGPFTVRFVVPLQACVLLEAAGCCDEAICSVVGVLRSVPG